MKTLFHLFHSSGFLLLACMLAMPAFAADGDGLVRSMVFSPDNTLMAVAHGIQSVKLYDANTGKEKTTLHGDKSEAMCVLFTPDNKQLVVGRTTGIVEFWDVTSYKLLKSLTIPTQPYRDKDRISTPVRRMVFTKDGKTLIISSNWNCLIFLDIATGTFSDPVKTDDFLLSIELSPDGTKLLGSGLNGTVQLWDVRTRKLEKTMRAKSGWVVTVVFSLDGKQAISGCMGGAVQRWDLETGNCLKELSCPGNVQEFSFSADRSVLTGACNDGKIRMWSADTGKLLWEDKPFTAEGRASAYSPNGNILATGDFNGNIKFYWKGR